MGQTLTRAGRSQQCATVGRRRGRRGGTIRPMLPGPGRRRIAVPHQSVFSGRCGGHVRQRGRRGGTVVVVLVTAHTVVKATAGQGRTGRDGFFRLLGIGTVRRRQGRIARGTDDTTGARSRRFRMTATAAATATRRRRWLKEILQTAVKGVTGILIIDRQGPVFRVVDQLRLGLCLGFGEGRQSATRAIGNRHGTAGRRRSPTAIDHGILGCCGCWLAVASALVTIAALLSGAGNRQHYSKLILLARQIVVEQYCSLACCDFSHWLLFRANKEYTHQRLLLLVVTLLVVAR